MRINENNYGNWIESEKRLWSVGDWLNWLWWKYIKKKEVLNKEN